MRSITDSALLKLWRLFLGWTQEQAARVLGVTLRHYSRYERDATVPPDKWRKVAETTLKKIDPPG